MHIPDVQEKHGRLIDVLNRVEINAGMCYKSGLGPVSPSLAGQHWTRSHPCVLSAVCPDPVQCPLW